MYFYIDFIHQIIDDGDIISVVINRYSNKPEFLRKKNENKSDNNKKVSAIRETERDGSAGLTEADLNDLEISDGSFIEFYKNG